jgi:hypothetical protein
MREELAELEPAHEEAAATPPSPEPAAEPEVKIEAVAVETSGPPSARAEPLDPNTFRGIVVERESGRPIAAAEIRVGIVDRYGTPPVAVTDAAGRFDLQVPALESWASVRARGYGPLSFPLSRDHASRERALRLELGRGASLGVEVRDPEGRPVSDIWVRVEAAGVQVAVDEGLWVRSPDEVRWDVMTDAAGRAELSDLSVSVPLDLSLYRGNAVRYIEPVALELTAGARREVRIELTRGTRVVGSVVDPQGEGVPGIYLGLGTQLRLNARAYHLAATAITGAQGEFVFEDVPAGQWQVRGQGWTEENREVFVVGKSFQIASGASEIRLTLAAFRDLFIEGQVLRADGQPAREIRVFSLAEGENVGNDSMETDASGRFRLGPLPPGWHRISAGLQVARARPGDPPVVLQLPAIGKLSGRVVDARTRAPLRADVELRNVEGVGVDFDSNADGTFAFKSVVAGRYELRAHTAHGELGTLGPIDVRADQTVDGIEVQVRPGATLLLESREPHGTLFTVSDGRGREWCSGTARGNASPCVVEPGLAIVRRVGGKREVLDEIQVTLLRGEQRRIVLGRATER